MCTNSYTSGYQMSDRGSFLFISLILIQFLDNFDSIIVYMSRVPGSVLSMLLIEKQEGECLEEGAI